MMPDLGPSVRRARTWIACGALAVIVATAACARQAVPGDLDAANTGCGYCRMEVSDVHFAAQIAAPGAEPVFFDDMGCLRDYLKQDGLQIPVGAVAFVADHRTGAWVRASVAVFTESARLATPMGGGIIAHASEDSRRQDPDAAAGTPIAAGELFGASGPPNGGRP